MSLKIVADLHTHSNISSHADSSIEENCAAAAELGLKMIATTDHGPIVEDGPEESYFATMHEWLPRSISGVEILHGIEANIINANGETDIDPSWGNLLDFGIASIHGGYFHGGDYDEFTNAYWKVLENPYIDLIGHMGTPMFLCDYEAVIKMREVGKLIEINARPSDTHFTFRTVLNSGFRKSTDKGRGEFDAHAKDQIGLSRPRRNAESVGA